MILNLTLKAGRDITGLLIKPGTTELRDYFISQLKPKLLNLNPIEDLCLTAAFKMQLKPFSIPAIMLSFFDAYCKVSGSTSSPACVYADYIKSDLNVISFSMGSMKDLFKSF